MIIRKLISLVFYLLVITAVVFVIFCIPLVKGLISCYDKAVLSFDDIEVSARSSGWQAIRVCQVKQDSVKTLEICVNAENEKSLIPAKIQNYIIGFLPAVRPNTQSVETRKIEHDAECADYPETEFYPSE
jgi:hypothetical protein